MIFPEINDRLYCYVNDFVDTNCVPCLTLILAPFSHDFLCGRERGEILMSKKG